MPEFPSRFEIAVRVVRAAIGIPVIMASWGFEVLAERLDKASRWIAGSGDDG